MQHTTKVQQKIAGSRDGVRLLECITEYKGVVRSQADGQEPVGFAQVPETVQVVRAELLQEMLSAGIEVKKVNKIRGWLERRMSVPLLDTDNLVRQYIGPLALLEHNTLLDEFKDDFIGVYHDGTTYMGEAFCIIFRCVKADFTFVLRVVKLAFLAASMNNKQISSLLMDSICHHMRIKSSNVLAFMHDSAASNLLSFSDSRTCCVQF
jgi:hypothetical protein